MVGGIDLPSAVNVNEGGWETIDRRGLAPLHGVSAGMCTRVSSRASPCVRSRVWTRA